MPSAVRGYGGKAKAIPPDAIGPAPFRGARLIEANRHHTRGTLSGAALFIDPTECKTRAQLFPESVRDYFVKNSNVRITFLTDRNGRAAELILHEGGTDLYASRIE